MTIVGEALSKTISRKGPRNCRSLGCARDDKEEGWVFPMEIGLKDPRSQKRDLGHPSISLFDIAEGTSFVRATVP